MRTLKLTIEYDGTKYVGWQRQKNGISIQQKIEEAFAKMTGQTSPVVAASRTDAGVHALSQIAMIRTVSDIPCERFLKGLSSLLPGDIAVTAISEVQSTFHARKLAKQKTYRYCIYQGTVLRPLLYKRAWHIWRSLYLVAMKRGAKYLVGHHDFASFQASGSSVRDAIRTIKKIQVTSRAEGRGKMIEIAITGNGFVRGQVRNIVGTLVWVGEGKLKPEDMEKILKKKDRKKAGPAAPACGLYLVEVKY